MKAPTKPEADQRAVLRFWKEPVFWLGVVSSLVFLWLALRKVSWPELLAALRAAQWQLILLGLIVMIGTWTLFGVRWQVLLRPAASVRWLDALSYILIGYLGNAILPLRLGDVARIGLMSQKYALNVGFTTAAVVLERLLDILTLVIFAGLLALALPLQELIQRSVQVAAVVALAGFLILALLSRSENTLRRFESLLASYVPKGILEPTMRLAYKFAQGLQVTRNLGQMLIVSLLSLLSWGIAALSVLCFVRAFPLNVPWEAAVLVLVITNLGGAIPSSPGTIGVYEFLALVALSVWASDPNTGLGFAVVTHVAYLALSIALGLIAAWREGVRLSALTVGGHRDSQLDDQGVLAEGN